MTETYAAKATRDGHYWFIEVPQIRQATQARNTSEAEAMVRDLVALHLDVAPDSFHVDLSS